MTSPWALGYCDGHFLLLSDDFSTKKLSIIQENNLQITMYKVDKPLLVAVLPEKLCLTFPH